MPGALQDNQFGVRQLARQAPAMRERHAVVSVAPDKERRRTNILQRLWYARPHAREADMANRASRVPCTREARIRSERVVSSSRPGSPSAFCNARRWTRGLEIKKLAIVRGEIRTRAT